MATVHKIAERYEMDKEKALDSALSQIERSFGKGSIMKLGQDSPVMEIESVSTGSIGLHCFCILKLWQTLYIYKVA